MKAMSPACAGCQEPSGTCFPGPCKIYRARRARLSNPANLSRESRRVLNADPMLCDDCPPVGYSTDKTRCGPCPRRAGLTSMQRLAIACGNEPYADERICPTCDGSGHVPADHLATACLSALASNEPCKPDDTLKRCTICGFVVDTKYQAEKPRK